METRKCNYKKICEYCGKEFMARTSKQRFCFNEHITNCCICGKEINLTLQQLRNNKQLKDFTCSSKCSSTKSVKSKYERNNGQYLSNETKEKTRKTNLERYGGTGFASKELQQKSINTLKNKYNIQDDNELNKIRMNKIQQTNLEKYGCISPLGNEFVREKGKKTNLKKYGVEYFSQTLEAKEKTSERFKKLFNEGLYEKIKQTNLDKYGVEHTFQTNLVREKSKQTKLEKYGNANYTNTEKANKTKKERYGSISYNNRQQCEETNLRKYGVKYTCILDKVYTKNNHIISSNNKKVFKLLKENNIDCRYEYRIENKSFDILIENKNIVLEVNPNYTHQSTGNRFFGKSMLKPLEKNYHINKTKLAEKHNLRCIHIFDWDNLDKIINLIKSDSDVVYARNLIIKEVSKTDADEFLNKYHLQNTCKGQNVKLGLYEKDSLIQIMTFGKPRYNKKYEWELLRLCSTKKVVGGAEKLFKYFIKNYNPKSIISYCDLSKFKGDVYERLGFNLIKNNPPSLHWCKGRTQHITDNLLRQRGYDQLFGTNYGKGTSNRELMIENKWYGVYDCGQNTYLWLGGKNE